MGDGHSARVRYAYFSQGPQEALLVEENNEKYGIVGCPQSKRFFRLPSEDMERFEASILSENLRDITNVDREAINKLVEVIKSTEEGGVVQLEKISATLSSLTSQ